MKKIALMLLALVVILPAACKKEKEEVKQEEPIATKFARYRVAIYKDKELKKWLATIEKAEKVDLLEEVNAGKTKKGEDIILAKIKISTDEQGFTKIDNLADKAVVFTEETKVKNRPNKRAKVKAVIPKGHVAFIVEEKGTWVKLYLGNVNGKYVHYSWTDVGYTTDQSVVDEALEFEKAVADLEKDENSEEAKEELIKLSENSTVFSDLAKEKLGVSKEEVKEELKADDSSAEDESDTDNDGPEGPTQESENQN